MSSKGRLLAQAITESRVLSSALTETAETPSFPITKKYANIDLLPSSGTIGDQAFVESTNRLYIWNGNGWYNIALINTNPSFDSGGAPESSYLLGLNDSGYISPLTITLLATDPEGIPITYSALISDSASNFVTVSQDSSVFTITPKSVDSIGEFNSSGGEFSITFRASDGVNLATVLSEFTVDIRTIIENSRYTTLMLKTTGVDTATNNTFVDGSTNNFTITRNGNTTQGTFSPYGDRWSNYFDGAGDNLEVETMTSPIGTGDFTMEAWIYRTTTDSDENVIVNGPSNDNGWGMAIDGQKVRARYFDTNFLYSTSNIDPYKWNHIAITQENSLVRIFVNGILESSASVSFNATSTELRVGSYGATGSFSFNGYISDARVVVGTALYTSDFTPPTEPLTAVAGTSLLTCQSNRFKDNSINDFAITPNGDVKVTKFSPYDQEGYRSTEIGGSGYFDGNGSYLSLPPILPETDDFTIEMWISTANIGERFDLYGVTISTGTEGRTFFNISSANQVQFFHGSSSGNILITGTNTISANVWHHAAVSRNGSNWYLFLDGNLEATATGSKSVAQVNNTIGARLSDLGDVMRGHIADLRVSNTALYTSDFTPPTEPLTAVPNTSLLCNFTNAGIYDASAKNVLETVGNAQVDTAVTKFGTGSMYFDGSGDYLSTPHSSELVLNIDDWTIEGWVNFNVGGDWSIFAKNSVGAAIDGLVLKGDNNRWVLQTPTENTFVISWAPVTGQWYHFAAVRNQSTATMYIDGIAIGSSTIGNTTDAGGSTYIGRNPASDEYLNGYIEDLRITKGLARYTSNFTPPSSTLEG